MSNTLPAARRTDLLNSVKPRPAKVQIDLNQVEKSARLLRGAIARSGLTHKEAMDALGVDDKGQFSRMLDGKEKLSVHRLLRPEAAAIWCELVVLRARQCGYAVRRVIEWTESA